MLVVAGSEKLVQHVVRRKRSMEFRMESGLAMQQGVLRHEDMLQSQFAPFNDLDSIQGIESRLNISGGLLVGLDDLFVGPWYQSVIVEVQVTKHPA